MYNKPKSKKEDIMADNLNCKELSEKLRQIADMLDSGNSQESALLKLNHIISDGCSLGNNLFIDMILDMLPVPVYYKDPYGVFIFCNKALANLYDVDKNDVIGKTVFDIFESEEAEMFSASDTVLINERSHELVEHRGRFSALGDKFQTIHKRVVMDRDGNIMGILGVVNDITEFKKSENTAWEGEAYYKSVYDSSPIPAVLFNFLYIIEDMNCAAAKLMGGSDKHIAQDMSSIFKSHLDFEKAISNENRPTRVMLLCGTEVDAITSTIYVGKSMRYSMIFIKPDMML